MNDARKAICGRDPPRALKRTHQAWRRVAKGGISKHMVSVKARHRGLQRLLLRRDIKETEASEHTPFKFLLLPQDLKGIPYCACYYLLP